MVSLLEIHPHSHQNGSWTATFFTSLPHAQRVTTINLCPVCHKTSLLGSALCVSSRRDKNPCAGMRCSCATLPQRLVAVPVAGQEATAEQGCPCPVCCCFPWARPSWQHCHHQSSQGHSCPHPPKVSLSSRVIMEVPEVSLTLDSHKHIFYYPGHIKTMGLAQSLFHAVGCQGAYGLFKLFREFLEIILVDLI